MQLIGTRFGDNLHHSIVATAISRRETVGQQLEFLDPFDGEVHHGSANDVVPVFRSVYQRHDVSSLSSANRYASAKSQLRRIQNRSDPGLGSQGY